MRFHPDSPFGRRYAAWLLARGAKTHTEHLAAYHRFLLIEDAKAGRYQGAEYRDWMEGRETYCAELEAACVCDV
jgi:hypothetical protein